MKKGKEIVEMNEKAIDAGASAYVKINVPAEWANAADDAAPAASKGAEKLVKMVDGIMKPVALMNGDALPVSAFVKIDVPASWADAADVAEAPTTKGAKKLIKMVDGIMKPVGKMDGDRLPVSAFVDHADGTFEQGASAYEKRGVAVMVPAWDNETCAQCNRCSFVCPHATIRPFALNEEKSLTSISFSSYLFEILSIILLIILSPNYAFKFLLSKITPASNDP
jgi:ferredoxin